MTLLEELKNRVRREIRAPAELLIRNDQFDQLADELNAIRLHPFSDVGKVTATSLRENGCWVFGIPVRQHSLDPGQ